MCARLLFSIQSAREGKEDRKLDNFQFSINGLKTNETHMAFWLYHNICNPICDSGNLESGHWLNICVRFLFRRDAFAHNNNHITYPGRYLHHLLFSCVSP